MFHVGHGLGNTALNGGELYEFKEFIVMCILCSHLFAIRKFIIIIYNCLDYTPKLQAQTVKCIFYVYFFITYMNVVLKLIDYKSYR